MQAADTEGVLLRMAKAVLSIFATVRCQNSDDRNHGAKMVEERRLLGW